MDKGRVVTKAITVSGNGNGSGRCGVVTTSGAPCQNKHGWGTDHVGDGPCKWHSEEATDVRSHRQKGFLEHYANQPITVERAAALCGGYVNEMNHDTGRMERVPDPEGIGGVSGRQVWHWFSEDDAFREQFHKLRVHVDRHRLAMWEDQAFRRIFNGTAPPAVEILFVVNTSRRLGDGRWVDLKHVQAEHNVRIGVPLAALREFQRRRKLAIKAGTYDDDDWDYQQTDGDESE